MIEAVLAALLMASPATPAAQPAPARTSARAEDPDQMICRQAEPVLGSRVARRRICRTRAQWQAFEEDRQQLRRDLNNAGNCGGAPSCTSD